MPCNVHFFQVPYDPAHTLDPCNDVMLLLTHLWLCLCVPRDHGHHDRDGRGDRRGGHNRDHAHSDNGADFKLQTLEEVNGQLLSVAQDQNGCRFLQRKFDEGGSAAIATVFPEVLDCIVELMVDPFGNYLVQKLLDRCSEQQRLDVSTIHRNTHTHTHTQTDRQTDTDASVRNRVTQRGTAEYGQQSIWGYV